MLKSPAEITGVVWALAAARTCRWILPSRRLVFSRITDRPNAIVSRACSTVCSPSRRDSQVYVKQSKLADGCIHHVTDGRSFDYPAGSGPRIILRLADRLAAG